MHPALHSWREELPNTFVRLLAYLGGAAALSMAAAAVVSAANPYKKGCVVKIGKSNPTPSVEKAGAGDARVRSEQASPTQETPATGEKVEISSLSSTLQQAEAAMASVPIVDQSKVEEIKQAISDGNFEVDAEKVADGLIESAREVLND